MQNVDVYDSNGEIITTLVQWDSDVYVYISDTDLTSAYDVHFCNAYSDYALVVESSYEDNSIKVKIPNTLLTVAYPIIGYINVNSRSVYYFNILVHKRPQPSDYTYVESNDYISISNVLSECKQYAVDAANSATNAEDYSTLSKSYAVGGTDSRNGEDSDNSKYYYEQSKLKTSEANSAATRALASSVTAENYASNASDSADSSASSANEAQEYLNEIAEMKTTIEETINGSLLSSSDEILSSIEDYFTRAEELYRSCMIVCDGETPFRRVRTIVEIDCHTPQRRATGYVGVEFDGGTPAIRLLGE